MEYGKPKNLRDQIKEAIEEAKILECARDRFDTDNMLLTAMRLSGAPYSFVKDIYDKEVKKY